MPEHHPATHDEPARVDQLAVEPSNSDHAVVDLGAVRVVVDDADLDVNDNLTLYLDNLSVASVQTQGVPLEVPNLVRRAIQHDERGEWSAEDDVEEGETA